jgi:hypothetical protein
LIGRHFGRVIVLDALLALCRGSMKASGDGARTTPPVRGSYASFVEMTKTFQLDEHRTIVVK